MRLNRVRHASIRRFNPSGNPNNSVQQPCPDSADGEGVDRRHGSSRSAVSRATTSRRIERGRQPGYYLQPRQRTGWSGQHSDAGAGRQNRHRRPLFVRCRQRTRTIFARLNPDGSLDTRFNPGNVGGTVFATALQGDGKLLVGGNFRQAAAVARNSIVRFNGELLATWPAGDSGPRNISLPIVDDALDESDETLRLELQPVAGGAKAGSPTTLTLTIQDNDERPGAIGPLPARRLSALPTGMSSARQARRRRPSASPPAACRQASACAQTAPWKGRPRRQAHSADRGAGRQRRRSPGDAGIHAGGP